MAKSASDPGFDQTNRCWFPNAKVADLWKSLHQPETLEDLTALPDRPVLQNSISIQGTPEVYRCENGDREEGLIRITSQNSNTTTSQLRIIGDGFTIDGTGFVTPPAELKVRFAPKGMAWGETRATVIIGGWASGDFVRTTLFGMVGEF